MTHDHAAPRHASRAGRKGRAEDRRQQLRRQPDGQGDGEHQGVQRRSVEEQVEPEHRGDHHQHHPQQQTAELAQAALELGFRRAQHQRALDMADLGMQAAAHGQQARRAAAQRGAAEQAVVALRQGGVAGDPARLLLHRKGLAGQQGLVDEAVARLDQPAIGRNQAAGRELDDIAGHHFICGQALQAPVAPDIGAAGHLFAQACNRAVGTDLVQAADQRAGDDDGQHDQGIQPVMGDQRHQRADQQDQHQRAGQLAQQRGADLPRQVRPVRTPDRRLSRGGSVAGEPVRAGLQAGVELIQRLAPVVRRDRLVVVCGPGPQGVPGEPEARQHRQPEAQYAKQQRCRQAGRQRHAGPAEGRHRGGLERTQPTRDDADTAQHAGQHEAGEDAGEGRRVADRVKQRPEGQGVKQDDQQGIAAGPAQQARIAREPGLGREHHRQQALHPAHVLQAPGQGALRQPGDQRCGDRHEAAEQHEGCAGGDHGETAMAAVDRDEEGGA